MVVTKSSRLSGRGGGGVDVGDVDDVDDEAL
jgi:hypothetical protein